MTCNRCGSAVLDAPTCTACAHLLTLALRDVPDLVTELETVLARLTVYAEQAQRVSGGTETPVPYDDSAGNVREHLHAILSTWVRLVLREKYGDRTTRPPAGPACQSCDHPTCVQIRAPWSPLPADRPSAMAGWLQLEVEWLRHHDAGAQAIEEITDAVRYAQLVGGPPAGRKSEPLGPCPEPGCKGQVRAYVPKDPDAMAHCDCTANAEHTWDSTQFMRLSRRIEKVRA